MIENYNPDVLTKCCSPKGARSVSPAYCPADINHAPFVVTTPPLRMGRFVSGGHPLTGCARGRVKWKEVSGENPA